MRNVSKLVLVGVLIAVWVGLSILFSEPHTVLPSIFFMGLLIFPILFSMLWSMELAKKHSPHASGYGFHTSLLQCEPVDSVKIADPKDASKDFVFHQFLNNGCKALSLKGGGSSGCTIVREDMILKLQGEDSNLWFFGVPVYYKMNCRPGDPYKPLESLPKDMYEMVLRHNFDPEGHVAVFWDPIIDPKKLTAEQKEIMNYHNLWEAANIENLALHQQIDTLTKAGSRLADAHSNIIGTFGPKDRRWYDGRQRPYDEDDGRDGQRQ